MGRELAGAHVVGLGVLSVAPLGEPPGEGELGAGLLLGSRGEGLRGTRLLGSHGGALTPHPGAQALKVQFGVDTRHLLEVVGPEGDVVGTRDAAFLVDPEDGRDVDHAVEVRDQVLGIDEAGMLGAGGFDPGAGIVGGTLDRDRDDGEALVLELLVDGLPDRQVVAAASPRGVRDEQDLLAALVAQGVRVPVEIGEGEVGRL